MTSNSGLRLAVSTGEPAGIGPDIVLASAQQNWDCELVVIADRGLLQQRATVLGLTVDLADFDPNHYAPSGNGRLSVIHQPLVELVHPALPSSKNANAILDVLKLSVRGCQDGRFNAMVTAPLNKAVICDAGFEFTGHTEYLAQLCEVDKVVMLLAAKDLRVALATTHIPLRNVPDAINTTALLETLRIIHSDLQRKFAISAPRISVLGLNPHAGENGHLGQEDQEIIAPAIAAAQAEGIDALGPVPADTAFNPKLSGQTDAYLAMYHDQGLPVLKYASFGAAVNVTLGLPIVRTSVDHGTAFDLAGTGEADCSSFHAAIELAIATAQTCHL